MPAKTREQKIDELIAKKEIEEALVRYTYGCDRCDEALLRSVYHADATDNHGTFVGKAADFAAWATDFHRKIVHTKHMIMNMLIEVDGDNATAQCYALVYIRMKREAPWVQDNRDGSEFDRLFGCRYLDRLENRDGEWKIADRVLLVDWTRTDPFKAEEDQVSISDTPFFEGARSTDDPSYRYLRSLRVSEMA